MRFFGWIRNKFKLIKIYIQKNTGASVNPLQHPLIFKKIRFTENSDFYGFFYEKLLPL
jgi:hypothetical protein